MRRGSWHRPPTRPRAALVRCWRRGGPALNVSLAPLVECGNGHCFSTVSGNAWLHASAPLLPSVWALNLVSPLPGPSGAQSSPTSVGSHSHGACLQAPQRSPQRLILSHVGLQEPPGSPVWVPGGSPVWIPGGVTCLDPGQDQ